MSRRPGRGSRRRTARIYSRGLPQQKGISTRTCSCGQTVSGWQIRGLKSQVHWQTSERAWQLTHIEWQVEGRRSASRSLMGSLQTVRQMMWEVGTMLAWARMRLNHSMRVNQCGLDCAGIRIWIVLRACTGSSAFTPAPASSPQRTLKPLTVYPCCLVLAESISKALIFISICSGRDALLLAAFQ